MPFPKVDAKLDKVQPSSLRASHIEANKQLILAVGLVCLVN